MACQAAGVVFWDPDVPLQNGSVPAAAGKHVGAPSHGTYPSSVTFHCANPNKHIKTHIRIPLIQALQPRCQPLFRLLLLSCCKLLPAIAEEAYAAWQVLTFYLMYSSYFWRHLIG